MTEARTEDGERTWEGKDVKGGWGFGIYYCITRGGHVGKRGQKALTCSAGSGNCSGFWGQVKVTGFPVFRNFMYCMYLIGWDTQKNKWTTRENSHPQVRPLNFLHSKGSTRLKLGACAQPRSTMWVTHVKHLECHLLPVLTSEKLQSGTETELGLKYFFVGCSCPHC